MMHEYAILKSSHGQLWLEVNGERVEHASYTEEEEKRLKTAAVIINGILNGVPRPVRLFDEHPTYGMPDTFIKRVIHPGDYEKVIEWILQALRSVLAEHNAKRSDGMLSSSFSNLFALDEDELKVVLRVGLKGTLG